MAAVEFTIKGLAVCYRKNESWKFIFPTDSKHEVDFYWTIGSKEDGPIKLSGKTVTFTSTDTLAPVDYEDPNFSKDVIDLTSDYLHRDGLMKRGAILMGTKVTEFQIPHAKLRSESKRDERLNFVFPVDKPSEIRLIGEETDSKKPRTFSNIIGGVINIRNNGNITIEITGETPKVLGNGDSFRIDNDCDNESSRNDFQLYQDIFKNKAKPDTLYEMISINNPMKFTAKNDEEKDSEAKKKPFTDPPPLICDTVRISNPSDLE